MSDTMRDSIRTLRAHFRERYSPELFDFRARVYTETLAEMPDAPRIIALSAAFARYMREKPVDLIAEDVLAGHGQFVDWKHSNPAPGEEIALLREKGGLSEEQLFILSQMERGLTMGLYVRAPSGHLVPAHEKLLKRGYDDMIREAKSAADALPGPEGDFARASFTSLSAAQENALRYADRAAELLAGPLSAEERFRVERMERACRRVAHEPPRDFFEAVQLFWLSQEAIVSEQICGSLSVGRVDQILYPYYEADRKAGRITREDAGEIIQAFWLKMAGLPLGYQNATLGGRDLQGRDMSNDLTVICLAASRLLQVDQPLLSLRVHPAMAKEVWEEAVRVIGTGMGFPALFNDEAIIPTRVAMGATPEEAAGYGIIGCVEPTIPGKEYAHTEGMRVNWAKVLELMLFGGTCPVTGTVWQLTEKHELSEFTDFAPFYAWYRRELANATRISLDYLQLTDVQYGEMWPTPYASSLMEGCLAAGKDVNQGGTVYNFSTVDTAGMANVADSLCAIEEGVFEKGWVALDALPEILKKDFEGQEVLRRRLLSCPKFGNDDVRADRFMTEISEVFLRELEGRVNPRGGRFQAGFYTVANHGTMGKRMAASPDGRRAYTALANSLSPVQGADRKGPTAVVASVLRAPMDRLHNGMVLDVKFHPAFFHDERHQAAIRALIEGYFLQGGQEIQLNVVDRETLLAAQAHPDEYRDLIVRVSGFSAYFVTLDKVLQNEIIARTEYASL